MGHEGGDAPVAAGVRPWLPSWPVLVAVLVAVLAGSWLFVAREHYLYSWDLAYFHGRTVDLAHLVFTDPFEAAHQVGYSVFRGVNYSDLFALPMVPFTMVFGTSRHVFITALAGLYLYPFVILIALVASAAVPERRRPAFGCAVAAALLTPWAWIPTLRGYPDIGGAAFLLGAILLVGRDPGLRRWRTVLAVGALLALSVIFRRYYLYGVLALLVAFGVVLLGGALAERPGRRAVLGLAGRLVAVAAAGAGVLAVLSPGFVRRLIQVDFTSLYASYERPSSYVAGFYASGYGGVVLAVALAGFVAGRYRARGTAGARVIDIVAVFGLVIFGLWVFSAKEIAECYSSLFTPVVVLGLALAGWSALSLRSPARVVAGAILGVALVANGLVAVAGHSDATPLGPRASQPYQRHDLAQVSALVAALRAHGGPDRPVFVAASSQLLNEDLIRNAERRMVGATHTRLMFAGAPQVDSADQLAAQALIRAGLVVMADPPQFHLAPSQQRVVSSAVAVLESGQGLGAEFRRLPGSYRLDDGMQVHLLERTRPATPADAVRSLDVMRRLVGVRPGRQPAWIVLSDDPQVVVEEGTTIELSMSHASPSPTLLSYATYPAAAGAAVASRAARTARVEVLSGPCRPATLVPGPSLSGHLRLTMDRPVALAAPGSSCRFRLHL